MQKTVINFITKYIVYLGIAAVLIVAWLVISGNRTSEPQTQTIQRGKFTQQVSVSGKVVAAQDVDLGFSQGGRVSGVYAKVGDIVQGGSALAEIENGELRASILQKQAALERERASLALLKEGTRMEELDVARSEVESDTVALAQARNSLVEAVKDTFTTSDDAIHNTVDQFIDNPRTNPQLNFIVSDVQLENIVEGTRRTIESTLATWRRNVEGLAADTALPGAVSEAQYNLTQVSLFLTDVNAALSKAVLSGSATQSVIDGYKTDVAAARSSVNASASALTTSITAERNSVSALDTARKNLTLKQAGTRASDVAAQEANVKAAEADLASARAQLAKTIIKAPFTGVVTKMDLKVGAIASANTSGVSMVSSGIFQIESFVPEVNVALISIDDKADVTLDAYGPGVIFSALILSIDPSDTLRDGISTYRSLLQFSSADPRIRSGMTANVVITTDERDGVISIPQGIVLNREGKKYARVLVNNTVEEREIQTGAISSHGEVEVLEGLSVGEAVVISAP